MTIMNTRDEFCAALAHELRGPLAPLRNSLDIARSRDIDDPLVNSALNIADRQVNRIIRLVDDLLDIARITSGQLAVQREAVLVADVLARSIECVRSQLDEHRHHLLTDIPSVALTVHGDADRLVQVFSNLLTNAVKYTPDEGHVAVALSEEVGYAVIHVQDTGIGLDTGQCERVFDLFTRVRESQFMPIDGLGIGLALARYLVEQHGGTITAHSKGAQRGACFTVRLPLVDVSSTVMRPPTPVATLERRRVLVVDDHRDSTETMALLLEALGHEARVANDGASALRAVDAYPPDLILLDLGLPDLDGFEVAQLLRLRPGGDAFRIVALTGWGQPEDRERSRAAGFDQHFVKPLSRDALETLVSTLADLPPRTVSVGDPPASRPIRKATA